MVVTHMKDKIIIYVHPETDIQSEIGKLRDVIESKRIPSIEMDQLILDVGKILSDSVSRARELSSYECQYDMERVVESNNCKVTIRTGTNKGKQSLLERFKKLFS